MTIKTPGKYGIFPFGGGAPLSVFFADSPEDAERIHEEKAAGLSTVVKPTR